jgi:tripartite-type tricarboxylate transporter receptor subunit TctC
MRAGIDIVRVPYPSAASAIPDLFAGRVQALVDPIVSSIEHIRAGRLRPLAVTTATRSEALPDVPVMGDYLPGYEASAWAGFGAPRNTPTEIVDKLNKEINACLADPRMKANRAIGCATQSSSMRSLAPASRVSGQKRKPQNRLGYSDPIRNPTRQKSNS